MSDAVVRLKEQLGAIIAQELDGWRRADIAVQVGLSPADVSRLRSVQLGRFSLETLVRVAQRLGYGVELRVTPRSARERGASQRSAGPAP